jgi:hypothetical protein
LSLDQYAINKIQIEDTFKQVNDSNYTL